MKKSRYLFSIFIILSVSIILLSTSYSKESGTLLNNKVTKETINNLEITYSKSNLISSNIDNFISIVNKNSHSITYQIELIKIDESEEDIYYQLDNNDIKFLNNTNIIYEEELSPYGTENDQITHRLNIIGNSNNKYIIAIKEVTTLKNIIKHDNNIYEKDNTYYYYGENPKNYIRYNNETYQILSLGDNLVKIISLNKELNSFNENTNYPTIQDIINTINDENANIDNINEYKTFLIDESYWLKDTYDYEQNYYYSRDNTIRTSYKNILHFQKEIKYINSNLKVEKGLGTKEEPYEVIYEGY